MTDNYVTCRIRVPVDHGLPEHEAVLLSRYAREFPCELHITWGHHRIDAKSIIEMIDLSHELGDEVVLELEAAGDDSRAALDCLSEIMTRHGAPARDELAYFGLAGAADGLPSLVGLAPRDALSAFALQPPPRHQQAPDPRELGLFSL